MADIKEITYDGHTIGKAILNTEGLYYTIECFCKLPNLEKYTVCVQQGETIMDLGTCIPTTNGPNLVKRVLKKHCDLPTAQFYMSTVQKKGRTKMIQLIPGAPLQDIDNLDGAVYYADHHLRCLYVDNSA